MHQYSVDNLAHSYHQRTGTGGGGLGVNPEDHAQAYYNDPYEPTPAESYPLTRYNTTPGGYNYDDDHQPILPIHTPTSGDDESSYFPSSAPTPQPTTIKRWKTVKKVELYKGNLVLDCPVPKKLLALCPQKEEREFTHMR